MHLNLLNHLPTSPSGVGEWIPDNGYQAVGGVLLWYHVNLVYIYVLWEMIEAIGKKRAVKIYAMFALARRRNESEVILKDKISRSTDAFEIFKSLIGDLPYEEFWILMLSKANKVIKKVRISEGGVSGTVVDPKKIYKFALDHHASNLILGHNHPSGNIQPSDADITITKKIKEAGMLFDIAVLNHLIIAAGYYSFADNGMV